MIYLVDLSRGKSRHKSQWKTKGKKKYYIRYQQKITYEMVYYT